MYNAFLVIRTVVFALLVYMHVLIFVFTSWNIASARSFGMPAPSASVFLLTNCFFILVLVPIAYLAEMICARARPAHVRVECTWTAFMSVLQLAASIDVTINGPPVHCRTHSLWALCASSSLLVHISWLVTFIILSYCLTLCLASATHATSIPDIWITPVPRAPWFRPDAQVPVHIGAAHAPMQRQAKNSTSSLPPGEVPCAISKYIAERWEKLSSTERQSMSSGPVLFTRGRQSLDPTRPAWARLHITRRGVDYPFAKLPPKHGVPPMPLALPPRTRSSQVVMSRDFHSMESGGWLDNETHSYLTLTPRTSTVFPRKVTNPDLPIPRPGLSQWVRANHGSPSMQTRSPRHDFSLVQPDRPGSPIVL